MSQLELTYFEGRKLGKQQVSIIRVVFLQVWCFSQGVSHLSTSKSKMRACFSCPSVWWSGRWVRITLDSLEEIESPCNHPVRSWAGQHRLSPSPGVHFCLLYEWTGRCTLIFQTCLPQCSWVFIGLCIFVLLLPIRISSILDQCHHLSQVAPWVLGRKTYTRFRIFYFCLLGLNNSWESCYLWFGSKRNILNKEREHPLSITATCHCLLPISVSSQCCNYLYVMTPDSGNTGRNGEDHPVPGTFLLDHKM